MSDLTFRAATPDDVAALHRLIERAYRGETAKAGWTHEADLLFDDRTSAGELSALIADPDRASEQLAAARFAAYGDSVYPDATGTLRLTYGQVEGSDVPGQRFGAFTTFAGLWDRATGAQPFVVAPKLLAAKGRIPADTVLNMAVSSDTIGGSSGSPAINARGQIIGANFDSTVLTQRNAYGYDRAVNRSVIVTTQAVTVALRDVYGMEGLVAELGASAPGVPGR